MRAPDGLAGGVPLPAQARRTAVPKRRRETRLANAVLDQLPQAIIVLDAALRVHYWNAAAAGLLGVPSMLAHDAPELAAVLDGPNVLSSGQRERLVEFCRSQVSGGDRQALDALLRLSFSRDRRLKVQVCGLGSGHWMLVMEDGRAASSERAEADAWIDALTGVSNRRQFSRALQEAVAQREPGGGEGPLALLVIDLDRFKAVNAEHGAAVGDALLCIVAQRLMREVRGGDLLARLGGDAFALLAKNAAGAEALASRITDVLSRPYLVEGRIVTMGASIGIAYQNDVTTGDGLQRHAERALRDAKAAGRGAWRVFHPSKPADADQRAAAQPGEMR